MKKIKTLDEVYVNGYKKLNNGLYLCSVCQKTYKVEGSMKKHIEARNCHSMVELISDTPHELKAYEIYKELIAATSPQARVSLGSFRKSKLYNQVARFTMYCTLHKVFSSHIYMCWLNEVKGLDTIHGCLSAGQNDNMLNQFRVFAQATDNGECNIIPSQTFYSRYKEELLIDDQFLINSIEQARIGVRFLIRQEDFDLDGRVDRLPVDYLNRFLELVEKMEALGAPV